MMKKVLAVLITVSLVLSLAGCAAGGAAAPAAAEPTKSGEKIELTFAHIFPGVGQEQEWLEWMAEEVSKKTDGNLIINIYADAQLGNESELTPQVISGDLAFSLSDASVWGDALKLPKLGVVSLPYICDSYDGLIVVGNDVLPKTLNKMLEDEGADIICMGAFSQGLRCIMTTDIPVRTAEDVIGLKIRVPETSLYVNTMAAMGASPTPIPSSELYSALSQGVVNAYENDPATVVARNLQEVLGYFTHTNHFAALNVMMMNRTVFNSLPEEYQKVLTETCAEASRRQIEDRGIVNDEYIKTMEEAGMEIIELPQSELDILKGKVEGMKEDFVKENGVEEEYAEMMAAIEAGLAK